NIEDTLLDNGTLLLGLHLQNAESQVLLLQAAGALKLKLGRHLLKLVHRFRFKLGQRRQHSRWSCLPRRCPFGQDQSARPVAVRADAPPSGREQSARVPTVLPRLQAVAIHMLVAASTLLGSSPMPAVPGIPVASTLFLVSFSIHLILQSRN